MDIFTPVTELLKGVTKHKESFQILQIDSALDNLLADINTLFQDQRKEAQEALKIWLQLLHNSLTEAMSLLNRYDSQQRQWCSQQRQWCFYRLTSNRGKLFKEIEEWKVLFHYLCQNLQRDFSIFVSAHQIVKSSSSLQDVASSEMKSAQLQLEIWLEEADDVQIIGVIGMATVGKTSLLKMIYDKYMQVRNVFEHVIWVTLFEDYKISDLQGRIAEAIKLDLPSSSDIAKRKMEISAYLQNKNFLLVLDDLRSRLDLEEVGVAFGNDKQSKVLFSTRRGDLITEMKADESIEMKPLHKDEAWTLFRKITFEDNPVPEDIELCARDMADECECSPLAITVVAAAMIGKSTKGDWETSLCSIKKVAHPSEMPELYRPLRWSYDALPNPIVRNCFLCCAKYPKDAKIPLEGLMQMWIAEGLVRSKQETHLMDMAIGFIYVKLLIDRCFFQNASTEEIRNVWEISDHQCIRVHEAIRQMAIYIIVENEKNCLFNAGKGLQSFPTIQSNEDCKKISLSNSDIQSLPDGFQCPKLESLFLSYNQINEVPSEFLVSLTSLKVLDLSGNERISSIPSSVGQLKQLEFLSLRYLCNIQDLPEEICSLSSLRILDLSYCQQLQSLPSRIGELKNLKCLNLRRCRRLRVIPHEISQLTSLSTLDAQYVPLSLEAGSETSIHRLNSLRSLTMLRISVKVEVPEGIMSSGMEMGIMGSWLEMVHLCLDFDIDGDYVMNNMLHRDMQNMRKLKSLIMWHYNGLSIPHFTCKFQHLQYLKLADCWYLKELSTLERLPNLKFLELHSCPNLKELGIGKSGEPSGFLMLEEMVLCYLPKLESIAGPSNNGVWNESTLPRLRLVKIWRCPRLERLPVGIDQLLNLRTLFGKNDWWQHIIFEDNSSKMNLARLFKEWDGRR